MQIDQTICGPSCAQTIVGTGSSARIMGRSTAKRPRPSAGPIRSLPGVVQGCGRRRCVTYPPCRSVSGFWLWFLVLCLCLGPAGAVGEGAVARCASSNHGPTLLAAGAAAALYAMSSAPLVQRGANAPLVPGGLLSPIGRLEMEVIDSCQICHSIVVP